LLFTDAVKKKAQAKKDARVKLMSVLSIFWGGLLESKESWVEFRFDHKSRHTLVFPTMSGNRKQSIFARQQWGSAIKNSSNDFAYKVDKTWMVPFEHHASNNSRLIFKTGNKDYTLDGSTTDAGGRKAVSEIGLKKRYS